MKLWCTCLLYYINKTILIVSYWPLNLLLWVYFSYYLIIIGLLICLFYTLIVIVCCLTHFLTCLLYSILHATFLVYIYLTTRVYAQRNAVKFSCLLVFTLFILRIFLFSSSPYQTVYTFHLPSHSDNQNDVPLL